MMSQFLRQPESHYIGYWGYPALVMSQRLGEMVTSRSNVEIVIQERVREFIAKFFDDVELVLNGAPAKIWDAHELSLRALGVRLRLYHLRHGEFMSKKDANARLRKMIGTFAGIGRPRSFSDEEVEEVSMLASFLKKVHQVEAEDCFASIQSGWYRPGDASIDDDDD